MIDYRIGDTREVVAAIPDGSVSLVATSPPFLALRSYLPADHDAKHAEIGSEPDPATFIDTLLGLTAEWGRVLAPWGSIAIELGDTYSGSGGAGGDYNEGGLRDGQNTFTGSARSNRGGKGGRHSMIDAATGGHHMGGPGWPAAKSLALIPQLYAIALAYGRNPLTGAESPAGRWRVRNVIVWHRPNPAVGCVDDATEALTPTGWKRHDEMRDGDLIATYDKATDSCRFAPAKFVRWHRHDEPMVAIEKRKTSQRLTMDHRVLVRTRKRPDPHVVLADQLTNSHQVMLHARLDPTESRHDVPAGRAIALEMRHCGIASSSTERCGEPSGS